jgi:hypothetical protein
VSEVAKNDLEENLLENDFNQCFEEARHYDKIAFEIIKFAFGGYTAVIAGSYALFRFGLENNIDFSFLLSAVLLLAFSIGLIFLWMIVRNRCYFVLARRYINEIRAFYIKKNEFEFKNKTKMYTDCKNPPYYNPFSTHSWVIYLISILNASLFYMMLFFCRRTLSGWDIIGSLLIVPLQIGYSINYLRKKEGKSADGVVFGKKEV